ncbi:MAG: hypothetical protein GC190_03685 [Alphaproteobacteria bacterium]|nr:hypothetical protein [Alphaproteobacteria bacterium]
MKAAVLGLLALSAVLATQARAATPAPPRSLFDAAVAVDKITVPAKGDEPKARIVCHYFPRFMVKVIDEGDVGASQLSIVPSNTAHKPKCQQANAADEKVVNADDWSGYFKGVKGDFIFFDADDGVNGGLGFAVFDADAKMVFEDSAFGPLHQVALAGSTLTIKYQRVATASCSVAKDGASCWTKAAAEVGVAAAPQPDCSGGYLKAKTTMAKGRCDADRTPTQACMDKTLKELDAQSWNDAPSVFIFEAQTTITGGKPTTIALSPALSCHPSD